MFRKLVSGLPFSPALVGQIGFYAKRLRREQLTRRLGLIFTVLALIAQSFAVFTPPEQAMASTGSSIIPGGVRTVDDILNVYDAGKKGQNDFKDLMDFFGVTRQELADMGKKVVNICSSDHSVISFGREHHYSSAEGELTHNVPRQAGGFSMFYSVPLYRFDSINHTVNCYDSFVGHSSKIGWFGIMRKCGNFQIKENVQKIPKMHLVTGTCTTVRGYAFDERQQDLKVKVYLYFNGPPGKGKQYGPLTSNQTTPSSPLGSGYGFNFAIPDEYQKSKTPTTVWAVMQPLPGWSQGLVQSDNTITIPGNCTPSSIPIAQCLSLQPSLIDKTHVSLTARANSSGGATIKGYKFTVNDESGNSVYQKQVNSSNAVAETGTFALTKPGKYTAKVVVNTSIGDQTSADCSDTFQIATTPQCQFNPSIPATDQTCKPCPYNATIWQLDSRCQPLVSQSKTAKNLTQNISNANNSTAKTTDRIEYIIYTKNLSSGPATVKIDESLSDVLQYARLFDDGGGSFDSAGKVLSWGTVTLAPQQTDTRHFVVQVNDVIGATPRAANDPAAFNCLLTNSYGNTISIHVQCPTSKIVESTVKELPSTGPGANVVFATVTIMIVTYFYARSRQMNKELRLIRKDFNLSTL